MALNHVGKGNSLAPQDSLKQFIFFSHFEPQYCAARRVPGSKDQLGCLKVCWRRWVLHLLHSMRLHISVGQLELITAAARWARINWQSRSVCGPDRYMWLLRCLMVKCNQTAAECLARIMTICIKKKTPLLSLRDTFKCQRGDYKKVHPNPSTEVRPFLRCSLHNSTITSGSFFTSVAGRDCIVSEK